MLRSIGKQSGESVESVLEIAETRSTCCIGAANTCTCDSLTASMMVDLKQRININFCILLIGLYACFTISDCNKLYPYRLNASNGCELQRRDAMLV